MNDEVRSLTDVQKGEKIGVEMSSSLTPFQSADSFRLAWQMASKLCRSQLVPKRFQGQDEGVIMDCLLALDMAHRTRTNPLMVLQNLYVVHGTPAWSGQFVIAMINQSGLFAEPLHFEFIGERGTDEWGCYAETLSKSGKTIKGPAVTIAIAKSEGWYGKNPKWTSIPELMLRYRAGSWFGRTECPELMMGIATQEEVVDAPQEYIDAETGEVVTTQTLRGDDPQPEPQPETETPKGRTVDMAADVKVKMPQQKVVEEAKTLPPDAKQVKEEAQEEAPAKTDESMSVDDMDYDDQLQTRGYYKDHVKGTFFNAHGEEWNPAQHATAKETNGPVINSDGHYRARRGAAQPEAQEDQPKAQQEQAQQEDPLPDAPGDPGYEEQPEGWE